MARSLEKSRRQHRKALGKLPLGVSSNFRYWGEDKTIYIKRGRGSRLSAWASRQSQSCESRAALDAQYREMEERFEGQDVPRPDFWGGFRLVPDYAEFWVGLPDRLHDRWAFRLDGAGWARQRLQP